jgi:hypothetical protein
MSKEQFGTDTLLYNKLWYSMTGDYTHASPEEMERAMELVAARKGRSFSISAKSQQIKKRPGTSNPLYLL